MNEKETKGIFFTKRACPVCLDVHDSTMTFDHELTDEEIRKVVELQDAVIGFMKNPCEECSNYMKRGIIFIEIDLELTSDINDPHRTGGFYVVEESYVKRMITDPMFLNQILKSRVSLVPKEIIETLGFNVNKLNVDDD